MSATIDTKVVEMKFDNDQFEKGVAESISTLDKLKEKLQDAGDGESLKELSKAANDVDMSSLADNVESIKNRFSLMGIVGMTAIQNIANEVVNLGKKVVTAVPSIIANGGWTRAMNLENAKFQLEGLGYTWDKVGAQISNAVNGTAYSLDSAAKAAGSLVASGVAIEGEGDALEQALTAISGVAAQTNSDYDSIANIFTTVAGNGRLMSDQLNQLSSRGLNAAATIAKVLGTTEANVRTMTSNGEIDFETFSNAMLEAFGEHAYEANNTFNGALQNMQSALKKIGAGFAEPIIQNAIPVFNALRLKINDCKTEIEKFAGYDLTTSSTYEKDLGELKGKWESLTNAVAEGTATQEEADAAYAEFSAKAKEYYNQMAPWEKAVRAIRSTIVNIINSVDVSWLSNVGNVLLNIGKSIASFIAPIKEAFNAVFNSENESILSIITEKLAELSTHLVLNDEASKQLYFTFQGLFSIIDLVGTVIHDLLGMIPSLDSQTFSLAEQIFKVTGFIGRLITAITTIIKQSGIIETALTAVGAAIGAVIGGIALAISKIVEVIKSIKNIGLSKTIDKISKKLEPIANKINEIVDAFKELFVHGKKVETQSTALNKAIDKVDTIVKSLGDTLKNLMTHVNDFLSKHPVLQTAFNGLATAATVVAGSILALGAGIVKIITYFVNCVKNGINPFTDGIAKIKSLLPQVTSKLGSFGKTIDNIFGNLNIGEKFSGIIDGITEKITYFKSCLAGLFGGRSEDGVTVESTEVEAVEYLANNAPLVQKQLDLTGNTVETFGDKLKKFFTSLDTGKLVAIGFSVAMVALSVKIVSLVSNLGNLMSAATGVLKKLGSGGVVGIIFGNNESKKSSSKIKEISTSILELSAALFVLSTIDSDSLKQSGIVMLELAGIIEVLVITLTVCGQISKSSGGLDKLVDSLGKMSLAIAALAAVMKLLDGTDFVGAQKSLVLIVELSAVLIAMAVAMTKWAPKFEVGLVSMIGFSVAILTLTTALKKLEGLNISASALGYFVALIAGIALAGKVAGNLSISMFAGLLAAALALKVALPILQSAFTSINMEKIKSKLTEFRDMFINLGLEAGAVIAGVVVLALFGAALSKATIALSAGLLAFATSVALIALVVKAFNKIKIEDIYTGYIAVILIGALMAGFMKVAKGFETSGRKLIAFSASLIVITSCITLLAGLCAVIGLVPVAQLTKGGVIVGGLLGMIALLMVASKNVNGLKTGPIVAMITGIVLVITEMIVVSLLVQDHFVDLLAATASITVLMTAFGKMMKKVTKTSSSVTKLGAMFTAAIVLAEIGAALYMLSAIGWKSLAAATVAMSACLIVYTECLKRLGKSGDNFSSGKLTAMIDMTVVLGILGTALYAISLNPWNQILLAMAAISACLISFAGAIAIIGQKGMSFDANKISSLVVMAGVLAVLGAALFALSLNPWESILSAMLAMSVTLAAVVAALAILSGTDSSGMIVSAAAILVVSAALLVLAAALVVMNNVDWSTVGQMAVMITLLTAALAALSVIGTSFAVGLILGAAAMIVMAGALVILAQSLVMMNTIEWSTVGQMSVMILVLVAALTALSVVGTVFAPGILLAAAAIIAVGVACVAIGAGISIAANGLAVLTTAFTGLVNAISNGINTVVNGFVTLANTFTNLSKIDFGSFSTNMSAVATAGLKLLVAAPGIAAAAVAIKAMAVAVNLTTAKMNVAFTKNLATLPTKAKLIGLNTIAGFSNGVKSGYKIYKISDTVEKVADSVVNKFRDVLGIHSPSTVLQSIGQYLTEGFGDGVSYSGLWSSITSFVGDKLSGITSMFSGAINKIKEVASGIEEAYDENGFAGIADYAKKCVDDLMEKITASTSSTDDAAASAEDYSDALDSVSSSSSSAADSTTDMSSAFEFFSRKVEKNSTQILNNMASNIKGTVDWARSIKNLYGKGLSNDLMSYLESLGTSGYETIKVFEKMTLEEIQTANALFAANMSLDETSSAIISGTYAKAGSSAGEAFSDALTVYFDEDVRSAIESAIDPFEKFSTEVETTANDVLNNMQSQIDGITEWTTMLSDLVGRGLSQDLLVYLRDLGPSGYQYVQAFSNMTQEQLAEANSKFATVMQLDETAATSLQQSYDQAGQWVTAGFVNGLDNNAAATVMTDFAEGGLSAFKAAYGIHSPSTVMAQNGRYVCQGFLEGIGNSNKGYWHIIINTLQNNANNSILKLKQYFSVEKGAELGRYLCQGLQQGISEGRSGVLSEIESMATAAIQRARSILRIASPSKEFKEIGMYTALGMAKGVSENSVKVEDATEEMSNDMLKNMRTVAAKVLEVLDMDDNFQPTIRPVLDLSNIQNGSKSLDEILSSMNGKARISTDIGAIAATASGMNRASTIPLGNGQTINNYTFNQTNNSPKSLDRYQIYRQTKNQIAMMKGVMQ